MPKRPPKPSRQAASPTGFTQAQIDAAVSARDSASAGNPRAVRGAFLGGQPIKLGELTIQPLTIGTFWLLEETNNPLAKTEGAGSGEISFPQLAEAALILTQGERAADLWAEGEKAFKAAARQLAWKIPIEDLHQLSAALTGRVSEASAVLPPEAEGTGKNPSEPPARIPASAGG